METENLVFEWDEAKRRRNIIGHGIDFTDALAVLSDPKVSIVADDRDHGEERLNAYGMADGRRIRLCFTWRGENLVRVITMFRVHEKEWRKYYGDDKNDRAGNA